MLDGTGRWMIRVQVKRRADVLWTDVSAVAGGDWVTAIDADIDTPDASVARFTVKLIRSADGASLSPGIVGSSLNYTVAMDFSPLIYPGRMIRVDAYCAAVGELRSAAVWHRWREGRVTEASWENDVIASCVNEDGRIQRRQIEAKEKRGSPDPGTPLPLEVQGLLDRWMGTGAVALTTIGDPEMSLGEYETEPGSLGDFLLSQARRIGWDIRHRWNDTAGAYQYTLYLPPRDKTVPDITIPATRVFQVPGLKVDIENVRNAFTETFRHGTTRKVTTRTLQNDASILEFDRIWMGITEDEGSPINDEAKADALLAIAVSDLGQPPTEKRIAVPFLPFLELHHMVRVQADGARFNYDQDYSVVGGTHEVSSDGLQSTLNLRGGAPVGMYYAWRRRNAGTTVQHDWLINLVETVGALETPTQYVYRFSGGDDVYEVWGAYQIISGEPTEEQWAAVAAIAEAGNVLSTIPTGTITVTKPTNTQVGLLYLVPKILDAGQIVTPPVQDAARYVSVYGPPVVGPSLDVSATSGTTSTTIVWSGDAVELSINSGTYGTPPASPIVVTRPAVGSPPLSYGFRGVKDGIVATDTVYIQPLDNDTTTADLVVTPISGSTNNTQAAFTATATRPDTGAPVAVAVRLTGCAGTNNGVALPANTDQTVAGTIIVFRPAFGTAAGEVAFTAASIGAAPERASRTVPAVQQDTVAPSIQVTPGTPTTTTMPISWVASASTSVSITWTTGLAVVFNSGTSTSVSGTLTITRPAAGSGAGSVTFFTSRDGINNSNTVTVPPVGADTVTPALTVTSPGGDDNYFAYFQASAVNPRTGAVVPVVVTLYNCTATIGGVAFASGSTLAAATSLKVARPAFGTANGTVVFRATGATSGEIIGGTADVSRDVGPSQQDTSWPLYEMDRSETVSVGTAWVKFVERGIPITSVQMRTQVGNVVSGWVTPTRGPGATSVVKGGTLGTLEYEGDVLLDGGSRLSQIEIRANLSGQPTPYSVPTYYFDRGINPRIIKAQVTNQSIEVQAEADTRSLKAYRTDTAGWSVSVDGNYAIIGVPIPTGSTWPVKVKAYSASVVDVVPGTTPEDERDVIVYGATATAGPVWSTGLLDAPALSDDGVTITLQATSAPVGYTMRVWARVNGGTYVNITTDTGSVIPTSVTTYTWATGIVRGNPPGLNVSVDVRGEILNASSVVVASTDNLPALPHCSYTAD